MSLRRNLSSSLGRDQSETNGPSRSHVRNIEDTSLSDVDQRSSRNPSGLNPVQGGLVSRDQVRLESHHEHHGRQESSVQPNWTAASEMRKFLESGEEFIWPPGAGQSTGNHCDISGNQIPLKWKEMISDSTTASINVFEASPRFTASTFHLNFAVKTLRESSTNKQRQTAATTVSAMKDLRHPHITALLGTFSYQGRLSIMMFPAATLDLQHFMKQLSEDILVGRKQSRRNHALAQAVTSSESKSSPASSTSSTSSNESRYNIEVMGDKEMYRPWLLRLLNTSEQKKTDLLRRYFVCLSQALSYLHESSVHHMDIKPSNILIDKSGSVILTNFGISGHVKRSPERSYTRKYAAPETFSGAVIRDDLSDVFSLGCVFLEMVTLLCGHTLNEYYDHYTSVPTFGKVEEAYSCNRQKVHSWIDVLRETQSSTTTEFHTAEALSSIRNMLDEDPQGRPISRTLWAQFPFISLRVCPDCDPRHPQAWRPNKDPEQSTRLHTKEHTELDSHDIESEVSSIVSVKAASIFSDQAPSSTTSVPEHQGAPEEFAKVLLTDEVMAPLYLTALHQIEIEKLERNLVRLLKSYAKDLRLEATTEVERTAVKFARRYAQSVANHLCQSLDPSRNPRYLEMHSLSKQTLRNEENIEQYLQQLAKSNIPSDVPDTTQALQDTTIKPTYAHSDDSGSNEADHPGFSNLRHVENFMTKSQAYARLRENFQAFVAPVSEIKDRERPNRELAGKHLPTLLSSNDSEGAIENRGEKHVDQDLTKDNVEIFSSPDGFRENREEKSVDQGLAEDHVEHISESDDSKDTTDTNGTTTDSSGSQEPNDRLGPKVSIKYRWYVQNFEMLKRAISLAAEFLRVWEKPIQNGVERVRWTCVCRRRLYDDFCGVSPDAIQELKEYLNHLYRPTSRIIAGSNSASQADSQCNENVSFNLTSTTIQPFEAAQSTPGRSSQDGSPKGLRRLRRHKASGDLRESYDLYSSCRWIFPIFQEKRHGRKLIHMPVGVRDSDESLFLALNRYYSQSTKRLARYLSLRGVIKIHYVRFVFTDRGPDIRATDHWPPHRHCPPWTYKGCPAKKKDLPLVGHSLLMHLWHNPSHSDRQSYYSHRSRYDDVAKHILSFFQIMVPGRYRGGRRSRPEGVPQRQMLRDPEATRGNTNIAPATAAGADIEMANSNHEVGLRDLETQAEDKTSSYIFLRTPKKLGGKLLPDDVDPPEGWGMYLEEGLRINRLFMFILLLYLSGSLVFGIFWYREFGMVGPQSGLGAFGVSSWMVSLMSIITTVWFKWAD